MTAIPRCLKPPTQSFFLLGPRGTGKSTWCRMTWPNAPEIHLLDGAELLAVRSNPSYLREFCGAHPRQPTLLIDEIQRAPSLLDEVHLLHEQSPTRQFVMTGSSARKLRRGGVNLLAGRALSYHFHPFLACELGKGFRLGEALIQGLLPVILGSSQPMEALRSYVGTYMKEEVFDEALVRNASAFSRFLDAIAFSHGGQLSPSAIAHDCAVPVRTVSEYVEILEDLLLARRITPFSKRAKRATVSHQRFYLFDAGVFRSLRRAAPLDTQSDIDGAALEGLVFQHLCAWADWTEGQYDIHFWRTRTGLEVDFVVYGETTFVALEVKNSMTLRPEDYRGLVAFRDEYPEATPVLLYRGKQALLSSSGILALPVEHFLRGVIPGKSLPVSNP